MKKGTIYTFITLIAYFITKFFLSKMDFKNTSIIFIDLFLIIVFIGFIFITLKNKDKEQGSRYNITVCVLMGMIGLSLFIGLTMIKCYPMLFYKLRWYISFLFLGSFITLTAYCIIEKLKYESVKNRKY